MSAIKKATVWLLSVVIILQVMGNISHAYAAQSEITVSAAMSLKNAFEEIGRLYGMRYRGSKVVFNFGASGDLIRQIEGGAPVDVFASAAEKDMDEAAKRGFLVSGSRRDFAANSLVLIVPRAPVAAIKGFEGLSMSSVKRVALGNPRTVPAGRYAEEIFTHYGLTASTKDKVILAENVRQVLDYVARGEADAGIVYKTDAMLRAKEVMVAAVAPEGSHSPAVFPIAVVKGTKAGDGAKAFISFVTSAEGIKVLEKYGFKAVKS